MAYLFDVVVVGAGVVGLACAKYFSAQGLEALSVESENYLSYSGKVPFGRLIYPVPEIGGLGIHLTLDLNGQARFGPDVEWIDELDYKVNEYSRYKFAQAIQTYWPSCQGDRLMPAYSGIRPKLGSPELFSNDFCIQTEQEHGVPGLVNLFGIESPGLAASLAIAEEVSSIFQEVRH